MKRFALTAAGVLLCGIAAAQTIEIRVSVKVISYGGEHNTGATQAAFDTMLAQANRFMENHRRGLRFVRSEFLVIEPGVPPPAHYFRKSDGEPVPSPTPGDPDPPDTFKVQPINLYQWWTNTLGEQPHECWRQPFPLYAENLTKIEPGDVMRHDIFPQAIRDNKEAFRYRDDQANLYVIWSNYCGGVGVGPGDNHAESNIYFVSGVDDVSLFLHEFGHFADLQHTFATAEGNNTPNAIGDENPAIPDTPPDVWYFDPDPDSVSSQFNATSLAQRFWGRTYGALSDYEKLEVRRMDRVGQLRGFSTGYTAAEVEELWRTWENLMSYHKGADNNPNGLDNWLFSEQQLDHMTDIVNTIRRPIASGRTWFASPTGYAGFDLPNGSNSPPYDGATTWSYGVPYDLAHAVAAARVVGGDIVLLAPGTYPNTLTIDRRVTLRATRNGPVTLTK